MTTPNFDSHITLPPINYVVKELFVLILFVLNTRALQIWRQYSKVQNLVTERGEIHHAFRPKNAQLLLENKSV